MDRKRRAKLRDHIIEFTSPLHDDIDQGKFGEPNECRIELLKFMAEIFSYRVHISTLSTSETFKSGIEGIFNGIYASESENGFTDENLPDETLLKEDSKMLEELPEVFTDVILERIREDLFGKDHKKLIDKVQKIIAAKLK